MPGPTSEQRQRVRAAFLRRRQRELLLQLPTLVGIAVVAIVSYHPDYTVAGIGGAPLLAAAVALIVAGLRLHARNWVCPACGRPLPARLSVAACRRCGAVFATPEPGESEAQLAVRALGTEQAVAGRRRELRAGARLGIALFAGMLLVATGGLLLVLQQMRELPRSPGSRATAVLLAGAGTALLVLSAALWARRRRAAELVEQQRAGLPPASPSGSFRRPPGIVPPPAAPLHAPPPPPPPPASPAANVASGGATAAAGTAPGPPPLSPVQQWVVAASANLCSPRKDRLDSLHLGITAEAVRETLGTWWEMQGAEDAEPTLSWLWNEGHSARFEATLKLLDGMSPEQREAFLLSIDGETRRAMRFAFDHRGELRGGSLVAWDMVRLVFMARACYTAGWIDEARAWEVGLAAARRLQSSYGSWAEMSANYLLGRRYWSDRQSQPLFEKHAAWLVGSTKSPWHALDWNLPLGTVYVN